VRDGLRPVQHAGAKAAAGNRSGVAAERRNVLPPRICNYQYPLKDGSGFDGASRKGDPAKVKLAAAVRAQTTMPLAWIARRLAMGSRGYLTWLLHRKDKNP
jgi:hypothetical protein